MLTRPKRSRSIRLKTLSSVFSDGSFQLSYNTATLLLLGFFAFIGSAFWLGHRLAYWQLGQGSLIGEWQQYLQVDRHALKDLEVETQHHLQVFTQHMGRVEANLMRINALGERLVESARLDPREFDFGQTITLNEILQQPGEENLLQSLKALDAVLARRYTQLNTLHLALQTKLGQGELALSGQGKQVAAGWISSFFGYRHDPFTGSKAWHNGVDIVGKEGSEVKAVAGGVVSFAASKGGYGQLVEINHGNGLSTRYGHNKEILVRPGQLVKKGQAIALLGSTGRSTAPHVHLEVHKNGQAVDPGQFFPDLKRT